MAQIVNLLKKLSKNIKTEMEVFAVKEGQLSVNLPMTGELLDLFRVQEEAQCGWNRVIRGFRNQIIDVARG